jgi:hypothetical protein
MTHENHVEHLVFKRSSCQRTRVDLASNEIASVGGCQFADFDAIDIPALVSESS